MSDLDDLLAFHSNPEVVRYVPWPVRDREQTRVALEAKLNRAELTEPGQWLILAMEVRETGVVIGEVLLKWESRERAQGELGFALNVAFHGQGLAREAADAVLRFGFEEFGLHRIRAVCIAENAASARLLERMGMRREAHLHGTVFFKGEWRDQLVYAMLADEWRERAMATAHPQS